MNKVFTFITGAAFGAIGALLLAPRSGQEARNLVADQAGSLAGNAQNLANQAAAKAQEVTAGVSDKVRAGVKQAADKGEEAIEDVKDAAAKGVEAASDKNDELRAKIDAARERIAAQVRQNAAETAQATGDQAAAEEAAPEAEATDSTEAAPEAEAPEVGAEPEPAAE